MHVYVVQSGVLAYMYGVPSQGVVVDKEFEVALEEVRETRPTFRAVYDLVLPVHQEKWNEMMRRVRNAELQC